MDGLPLVILSSGVQERRPFFISWHFGPNPPRAGELDAETRGGISATGDAMRRHEPRDWRHAGRRDAAAFSDSDDGTTKKPDGRGFALAFKDLLTGEPDRIFGDASGVEVGACGKAAAPSVLVGLLSRLFRTGARTRFARKRRPPRAATCATSRPWRSFLTRGRERRKDCRAPMRNELLSPHNPVTLSRKSIL